MSVSAETVRRSVADKQYLTTGESAKLSGFTIQKIRRLVELGRIPATNTSTGDRPRWTIRRADLEAFLTPTNVRRDSPRPTATRRRQRLDANVPQVF